MMQVIIRVWQQTPLKGVGGWAAFSTLMNQTRMGECGCGHRGWRCSLIRRRGRRQRQVRGVASGPSCGGCVAWSGP